MKILSLETSTKTFSLSIGHGPKILAYRNIKLKKVLSSSIIPAIENILKKTNLTLNDLDGLAVGLGPGSFTSLRVGLSTVKALSLVTQKSVVGIPSLDVLAAGVPKAKQGTIVTLVDARRNLLYAAIYERQENMTKRVSDCFLISIDQLLLKLKMFSSPIYFVGDGLHLYRDQCNQYLKSKGESAKSLIPVAYWYPQAKILHTLAYQQFLKNNVADISTLTPMYLYAQDCQVA